jgi:hypothetical protein
MTECQHGVPATCPIPRAVVTLHGLLRAVVCGDFWDPRRSEPVMHADVQVGNGDHDQGGELLASEPGGERAGGRMNHFPIRRTSLNSRQERGRGHGLARGPATVELPARPVPSVLSRVASVQLMRPPQWNVLMVKRRSTVRFRKGAPGLRLGPVRIGPFC